MNSEKKINEKKGNALPDSLFRVSSEKAVVFLKYIMPFITVAVFIISLAFPSVFFIHDGDVKRGQSLSKLADSTYNVSIERLEKLEKEEAPDQSDMRFGKECLFRVVAVRSAVAISAVYTLFGALVSVFALCLSAKDRLTKKLKLVFKLAVPGKWWLPVSSLLCLFYAFLPDMIAGMYKKYYLYDVKIGYIGLPPYLVVLIPFIISVVLIFTADPLERKYHMNMFRRY